MKLVILSVVAWLPSLVSTSFVDNQAGDQVVLNSMDEPEPRYLIEFANGQTRTL